MKLEMPSDIDIRSLSRISDKDNHETYISLYVDIERGLDQKFLKRRIEDCRKVLKHLDRQVLNNFDETVSIIDMHLPKKGLMKGHKGTVVFASAVHEFLKVFHLSVAAPNKLVVDSSPYIRPLARLKDEYEDFLLLMIDSNCAKLFEVSAEYVTFEKDQCENIMQKHSKGGWSQGRFQRLRRQAIDRFQKEIAEEVGKHLKETGITHLIVAGSGVEKDRFIEKLPKEVEDLLLDVVDMDRLGSEREIIDQAQSLVSKALYVKGQAGIDDLRSEILKDGLAVYGIKETLKAAMSGTVERLFICKDHMVAGWKCERCQVVETGKAEVCPHCKRRVTDVDVIEEMIEYASRFDSDMMFVEDDLCLAEFGGIGALLRYK